MSFAVRGLVEGFYGRLWTWPERGRVLDTLGEAGFTTYVYAPKEDRLQNAAWRDPYPAATEERLAELVERCAGHGMQAWLGVRPVGFSYADGSDLDRLLDKMRRYRELGAGRIVLLADDIPGDLEPATAGVFGDLAEAHAWLVESVLAELRLPPERLVFVPTDYHGFGSRYLGELGRRLPHRVDLCWTGRDVFAPEITPGEVARITAVLRRAPLIWDNYPVNDEHDHHDLRMGPIRGRAPGLAELTRGVLVNPALEPEAARVPLLTWGEYLADPGGYDPRAAWQRALRRVAGSAADAEVVATLAAGLDHSILDQAWRRPPRRAMARAAGRISTLRNRALADELAKFLPG